MASEVIDFQRARQRKHRVESPDPYVGFGRRARSVGLGVAMTQPQFMLALTQDIDPIALAATVRQQLADQPVEDGIIHPLESVLRDALETAVDAPSWMRSLVLGADPKRGAEVLRLVARIEELANERWVTPLVADALASRSIELRDAAMQAVESWNADPLVEALAQHQEPVSWLRQYQQGIVGTR